MRRFLSATLALALLSGTAAYADPFGHGPRYGHHERWDGGYRHHHSDGAGAAVAVGFGLLALTAILASQDRDRGPAYDNYPPPPPNRQDYDRNDGPYYDQGQTYDQGQGYGQDQGYRQDQGYGQNYGRPDAQYQQPTDQRRPQGRQ